MRLLGLTPCFDPTAADGATRFTGRWAQALGEAGANGNWLATTAAQSRPTSAWSARWPAVHAAGDLRVGALRISRYPTAGGPPSFTWKLATRIGLAWMRPQLERARARAANAGPAAWRDVRWPAWIEAYILAGLGPSAPALWQAWADGARDAEVAVIGYPPLGLAEQACQRARQIGLPIALLPLFHANDPLNLLPRWRRHYESVETLLALTDFEADVFRELFAHPNVHVIGAGIDAEDVLAPSVSGRRFREAHRLGDAPFALYIGRKESGKNYRLAIEAVRSARVGHTATKGLKLVMIGADVDGAPLTPDDALFLGQLPRAAVLDALDACTVLINPSTSESFGLTVLEAWARRKPVVAHAGCGPFRSIVTHDVDGWLERDVAGMSARIALAVVDPARAAQLGEAGFATVHRRYLWSTVAERSLRAFEGPLARRTSPA